MSGLNVRKGDKVGVVSGKAKGKRGKVLKTLPKKERVVVEGHNMIKRAVRPTQKNPQGGFIDKEGAIHVSNVMLVCPNCDKETRIGHRFTDQGQRLRVCRRCGADIDKE